MPGDTTPLRIVGLEEHFVTTAVLDAGHALNPAGEISPSFPRRRAKPAASYLMWQTGGFLSWTPRGLTSRCCH